MVSEPDWFNNPWDHVMNLYHFKRYRQGREMAEDCKVQAETEDAARAKARAMYSLDPGARHDEFRLAGCYELPAESQKYSGE